MFPYTLEYQKVTKGTYDIKGDYQNGSSEWVSIGKCDAVPAGRNNVIQLPDGKTETFSYVIRSLSPECREFKYGEKLRLSFGGQIIYLSVKGFARYQLQSKIWA